MAAQSRSLAFAFVGVCGMLALSGCASSYATVREQQPRFRPLRTAVGALGSIGREFQKAQEHAEQKPLLALGELLLAAQDASRELAREPASAEAREAYNFALARIFGLLRRSRLDAWSQPLPVPTARGEFVLTHRPDPRPNWNPALYDFLPADQFDVGGTYVRERHQRPGIGAPIVAVARATNSRAAQDFTLPRSIYGATAVLHFQGRRAVFAFEDPLASEEVIFQGRRVALSADFTVPLAVMLASTDTRKMELARLLRPGDFAETARIVRLQPFDPKKQVVLVVHGLMDSPATWAPLINALRSSAEIRRRYQFWFFSYPSGYPYPYSAALLRRELDAVGRRYPLRQRMVVLGHSMGGCISRLLITETDRNLYDQLLQGAKLSPETRRAFEEALIFRRRREVGRVVFISAPLRGANLATHWAGRLGSRLVKVPLHLLRAGQEVVSVATFQQDELRLTRMPTSIDTLAPNNRFVRAIQKYPLARDVPYHVICGDRGKGGNKDQTAPAMSDGVVPYWSSHLDGARSELIVPSDHSTHQNPQAIEEVRRILLLPRR